MKPRSAPLVTAISATGASAGVLFALQHHADAGIIYSGLENIAVSVGAGTNSRAFDVNSDAVLDFNLKVSRNASGRSGSVALIALNAGRVLVMGSSLQKLAHGAIISNGAGLFGSFGRPAQFISARHNVGVWSSGEIAYAGFKLPNDDLGWMRLKWTDTGSGVAPTTLTAIDWGYDTTPGEAIQAGQGIPAPEPGTTALLALAGGGAAFLRRRRGSEVLGAW